MKNVMSALYRALCHFALAFTGIMLFFGKFMTDNSVNSLKPESISIFASFALIFGISSFVEYIPGINRVIKVLIHFAINLVGFFSTFASIDGTTQIRAFVASFVFVIIYAVVYLLSFFLKKLANKGEKNNVRAKKTVK